MGKVDTFANRLRTALKERDMKQVELCQKTGIGKSSLSQYLSGEYEPHGNRMYLFANALNVSLEWLMGYDVPMDKEKPMPELSGTGFEGMSYGQLELYLLSSYLEKADKDHPNMTEDEKKAYIKEFFGTDAVSTFLSYLSLNRSNRAYIDKTIKLLNAEDEKGE